MSPVTPELLAQLLDAHADALELFAAQWSQSPADVVQNAFVELAQQPAAPQNVVAWLYRVVRNFALSEVRSTTRRRRWESAAFFQRSVWFQSSNSADADPHDAVEVLRELPLELREVVVARIWGGLTFEQIAALSATSTSTAFRRYEEAIAFLRTRLGIPCPSEKTTPN